MEKKIRIIFFKNNYFVYEKFTNIIVVSKWSVVLKRFKKIMFKMLNNSNFEETDIEINYMKFSHRNYLRFRKIKGLMLCREI